MIFLWILIAFSNLSAHTVNLCFKKLDIENANIQIAIHNTPETFLNDDKEPHIIMTFKYQTSSPCLSANLTNGKYAIAFFHDTNGNLRLDTNILGIPKEEFGFSQNPKITFGPPSFNEAAFDVSQDLNLELIFKKLF